MIFISHLFILNSQTFTMVSIQKANGALSLAHQALHLWSTKSSSNYQFPSWVADEWDEQILPTFGPTAVIYHASDNLPEVRTMAVFREPTNIAMDRKGSRRTLDEFYQSVVFGVGSDNSDEPNKAFLQLFPEARFSENEDINNAISTYYRNFESEVCDDDNKDTCTAPSSIRKNLEGAYRFTNKNYRMPQIAAYAKTPMRITIDDTLYSNEIGVHVLNLVGAGFDAWQQPDYQYYFDKRTQDIRTDRQEEFYRERQVAFIMALQCAFDHKLDRIEFVPVGAGAFSILLPPDKVLEVLSKAWESDEVQSYKSSLEQQFGKVIHFSARTEPPYSHNNGLGPGIPSFYEESGWTGEGHGMDWKDAINRTLFINAWDPWSLVGNGNEYDYSVDGMYGRQSALSLLCWPVTNPHIEYKKVAF